MTLRVAFQMDPLSSLDLEKDSTLALIEEGEGRGHQLYAYQPADLVWREGHVGAWGSPLKTRKGEGFPFSCGVSEFLRLEEFDILFIRQDPPFDIEYITATYLLEHLSGKVLMINDPYGLRQSPEKLLVTHFLALMAPTLVSQNESEILDFLAQHNTCVIKPLYGFGGEGVMRLTQDDPNTRPTLELFRRSYPRQPWVIQKFLPEILEGDRRLFLLDGEFMGAFNRIPPPHSIRSNTARGGLVRVHTPTARDLEICQQVGPLLKKLGLFFAGLDIIGSSLTEINVTSPTGLRLLDRLYSMKSSKLIWDKVEKKVKAS